MALSSHRIAGGNFFFTDDNGYGIHVAMADGSVHFLRTDCLSPEDCARCWRLAVAKTCPAPHVVLDAEGRHLNWPTRHPRGLAACGRRIADEGREGFAIMGWQHSGVSGRHGRVLTELARIIHGRVGQRRESLWKVVANGPTAGQLRVTKRYVDERPKTHQDIDDQADHATHGASRCPLTPPYNS